MTFRATSVGNILLLSPLIASVAPLPRALSIESCGHRAATGDSAYVGRYRQGAASVLIVRNSGGRLTARPTFWGATQPLQRAVGDSFFVSNRPERRLTFHRDPSGCVAGVTVTGQLELDGTFPRLADGERAPIELLLEGQGQAALTALRRSTTMGAAEFAQLGERILNDLRGDVREGRAFLQALVHAYPQSADAWAELGQLQIATADRERAVTSFRRAYALDSTNAEARNALARLQALPSGVAMPAERLHLPFPLADVFRAPADQERSAVARDWASRDLTPQNVTIVARERVQQGADRGDQSADTMTALIVAHDVHGFRHYGTIIIPDGATPGCCAVVLQVKSFDPEYAPLDIATEEPATAAILDRSLAKKVIYVLPSYRGEALTVNGKVFTSQGDRRNAWDGATDDALALLEVAVRTVPEVDSSRVCVLGMSRGGTIALLAGERSRRIKCVVDISGPVDWFRLMPISTPGWTTKEVVEGALRSQQPYSGGGGWYLQWFLDSAIAGKWTLSDVRHRMLASSPAYFAERLPPTQAHHGVQDDQVPVANGHALKAEFDRLGRKPPAYAVFFYPDNGHDTDVLVSYPRIAAFLTAQLGLDKPASAGRRRAQ
jgi:dienelactone hydrolase